MNTTARGSVKGYAINVCIGTKRRCKCSGDVCSQKNTRFSAYSSIIATGIRRYATVVKGQHERNCENVSDEDNERYISFVLVRKCSMFSITCGQLKYLA